MRLLLESEALLREAFGLNMYEVKVYIALLRNGMNAKESAIASGVPLPRIYDTLRSLEEKGFVKESAGKFFAIAPDVALESRLRMYKARFEEEQGLRERAMKMILNELQALYKRQEYSEPVLLRGIDSIAGAFSEIIKNSSEIILLIRKAMKAKGIFISYLEEIDKGSKGIRILVPRYVKLSDSDIATIRRLGLNVRVCDDAIIDLMVGDNSDVILGVPSVDSDEPFSAIAVWVKNPSFAKSVKSSLENIWRKAINLAER